MNEVTKKFPAIVITAYNRPRSLERLLVSIAEANFPEGDIPLVISVDKSDSFETLNVAKNFNWERGNKEVIERSQNLGLREHVLSSGGLVNKLQEVVLLEDDLYLSPYFYLYALQSLKKYKNCSKVAGISLYAHSYNESAMMKFRARGDGFDNYFLQIPSSWGLAFTSKQWNGFHSWYESHKHELITSQDVVPDDVIKWPESSWKKYFIKYLAVNDLYFSYPRDSLSTNFMDPGVHHKKKLHTLQVELLDHDKDWKLSSFEESNAIYDCYCEIIPSFLEKGFLKNYDFEVDLYGEKNPAKFKRKYFLTTKRCFNPVKQWDLSLVPHENNILFGMTGDKVSLVKRGQCFGKSKISLSDKFNYYYSLPPVLLEHYLSCMFRPMYLRDAWGRFKLSTPMKPVRLVYLLMKKILKKIKN